ncbi:transposase [Paraburkholderia sp. MMS20-SJTR3]|uniref:Transposase n=1 Tax=Paraburkholderia sejongensis TaxID=2886946 RepID=A0ABS8JMM6_9BURK|nr:transposase [Paraburkholderia sp. MMS20-SJTR3]MCC8391160.1 transposase [Paraburkholderia sp. MMS20-SJTR3]
MNPYREMTEEQWLSVEPLLPELQPRRETRGRPLADTRAVLNGVLWVMQSGASWSSMPRRYPSYQTCHRRFKAWSDAGVLRRVVEQLLGGASADLCDSMAARMRTRVSARPKRKVGVRAPVPLQVESAPQVESAVRKPASAALQSGSPSAPAESIRQAA